MPGLENLLHANPEDRNPQDQRAKDLDRYIAATDHYVSAPLDPAYDPHQAGQLQKQAFGNRSNFKVGRVQFCLPHLGWYRVAVEDLGGVIPCCKLSSDSSCSIAGVTDTSTYAPDTAVLVFVHPTGQHGYIMGAIPTVLDDGNYSFSDNIVQGSGVGTKHDKYCVEYINKLLDEGGAIDFSAGRPLDSLSLDWGRHALTGVGVHIDDYLSYLRVSEICGIFCFYPSNTTRIAGLTTQFVSAVHNSTFEHDEGENVYYHGESPYYWEQLGVFEVDNTVHRETSDVDVQFHKPLAKHEPTHDDQQPFARYEEYGGYLGQGRIRQMAIPPKSPPSYFQYSTDTFPIGVFREHIGLDGSYMLQSAKSISLVKRSLIPIPKRKKLASDYSSDADSSKNDNYKFAGQFGGGDEHKIGDPAFQDAETNLVSMIGVLDGMVHTANWKGPMAFHYHKKDFKLEQETATELEKDYPEYDFYSLQSSFGFPDAPEPTELDIDHRYSAKFYQLLSMLTFTDDGGIVLQGGQGAEIRMVRGQITISAPDCVVLQPGKSIIGLAGDDIVMRAFNSIDLTTTKKDVRIKAERNLMALAANSGKGALLLESRATSKTHDYPTEGGEKIEGSGIVLKAAKSQIIGLASEIYLRTGNAEGGINNGDIVLDASKGNGRVISVASKHIRFSGSECLDAFGLPKVQKINRYTTTQANFGGSVYMEGGLAVKLGARIGTGVVAVSGSFSSRVGGMIGRLTNPAEEKRILDNQSSGHLSDLESARQSYTYDLNDRYYVDTAIGDGAVQKKISFSLRTEKQYNTDQNFKLPQTHWQLLANTFGGGAVKAWQEKAVKYQDSFEMMPWPGKEPWTTETFLQLPASQHTMYDVSGGASKDRPTPFEEAKYGQLQRKKPESFYTIVDIPD